LFENKDSYEGLFKKDKINGSGEYIYENSQTLIKYVGNYEEGVVQGKGELFLKNYKTKSFKAIFSQNKIKSVVNLFLDNLYFYSGEIKNCLFDGYGYYVFSESNSNVLGYKGNFECGMPNGLGKLLVQTLMCTLECSKMVAHQA